MRADTSIAGVAVTANVRPDRAQRVGPTPEVAAAEVAPAPVLSVIIVAWNVREHVLACLRSIRRTAADLALEILVVDNASSDGTSEAVRREFPDVVLIENERNIGFPRANNQALRAARGELVLFLNPDTEVGDDALAACVEELRREPGVGMVGCKLLYADGGIQLECARRPYLLRHLVTETLYLHMLFPRSAVFAHHVMGDWDHEGTRDVEAICGAFMMVRRSVALEVGGLPDDLFMYQEDLSFCLRVRRAGWKIRYLGDWSTVHHWRQSSSRSSAALALLEGECKLRLIREAQGPLHGAVGRVVFAVRSLLRLMVAAAGLMLPERSAPRRRYPRVFDARRHALQLAWSVAPWTVRARIPTAPAPEAAAPARPSVLVVGPLPPPHHGGAMATRLLLDSPLAREFEVVHVDTSDRRGLENIGRLEPGNIALAVRHGLRFLRLVRRHRPALVYVPIAQNRLGFLRDCLFLLPGQASGARTVVHVHGGGFGAFRARTDPLTRGLAARVLRRAARVIVLGDSLRETVRDVVPAERLAVVPNGVPDAFAAPTGGGPGGGRPADATCRVLYLGTLMEAKGYPEVLAAARLLAERGARVRFTLAGGFHLPRDREQAERLAYGLENVGFAGVVDGERKAALLRESDVFVFPTRYDNEAHPYVVLEAMAAGLPVIATARAAIPETVIDGVTGVLVPEADAGALAGAIERLARDPALRAHLGAAARARFLAEYRWERWAERMARVFREALAA